MVQELFGEIPGGRGRGYRRYDLAEPQDIRFTTTYSYWEVAAGPLVLPNAGRFRADERASAIRLMGQGNGGGGMMSQLIRGLGNGLGEEQVAGEDAASDGW